MSPLYSLHKALPLPPTEFYGVFLPQRRLKALSRSLGSLNGLLRLHNSAPFCSLNALDIPGALETDDWTRHALGPARRGGTRCG